MMTYIAYKITCSVTDKIYIGVTKRDLTARWADHKEASISGKPNKLYQAIRKHGIKCFAIEAIACARDAVSIFDLEQMLIAQENSFHRGYNMTLGGDGPKGLTHSAESRERMRQSQLGKKRSPEVVAKIANANRGRKFPPRPAEWCAKIAAKSKGRKWKEGQHELMAEKMRGRKFTPEWCAKISAAKKGKSPSPEQAAAHSVKMRGKKYPPRTEEHRRRLSENAKLQWAKRREADPCAMSL